MCRPCTSHGASIRQPFLQLAPDVARVVDNVVLKFMQPGLAVQFVGWDDRIANGFCGSCNLEVQLVFAAFTVRACADLATSLRMAGDHANATRYSAIAARLAKQIRARPSTTVAGAAAAGNWTADYGVHAASYLINAKLVGTADEQAALARRLVSHSGVLLSRRGRTLPASASGVDNHRDSVTSLCGRSSPTRARSARGRRSTSTGSCRRSATSG
jgi:hypothetical protein